jgi:hypothetical protein
MQSLISMKLPFRIFFLLFLAATLNCIAQPEFEDEKPKVINKKGFQTGLYLGSYFANDYTAELYDGYGFDAEGKKNLFESSFMYQKIVLQYGGGYGYTDEIALALNVDPNDWNFDESDMPVNMSYKTAFNIGWNNRYSVDNKNAVIFNINASRLTVAGNFSITTRPPSNSTQINNSIRTFAIKGVEQRLFFQAGYQRILGNSENLNFFIEGGLHATLAKFDKNEILIEYLLINLVDIYDQPGYPVFYPVKKPVGLGFGAFAGLGINLNMNDKWTMQLVYNPTLEKINIVEDPKLTLNNGIGLRMYYKIK